MSDAIQSLCEQGQAALLATDYLAAERCLVAAEALAWTAKDYDALARLYMPLQEARRQRRQLSGDGAFAAIVSRSADELIDVAGLADRHRSGQLIVAGYGSIAPAAELRALAAQRSLYLDLPLSAAYVIGETTVVVLVPLPGVALPSPAVVGSIDALLRHAPPHSVVVPVDSLPPARPRGDPESFGYFMNLWESLHAPFLALADAATEPHQKLAGYRQAIRVDYACEFAHQRLSHTARTLARHAYST